MSIDFFDRPLREPSQFIGFSGNQIDRQSEKRSEESLPTALAHPDARVFVLAAGKCLLRDEAGTPNAYLGLEDARALGAAMDGAVLLGTDEHGPVLAASSPLNVEETPAGFQAIDLRTLNMKGIVDEAALGALSQGASLLAWHGSHAYCSRCGTKSEMRIGGYKRACPACSAEHFPRTDPVAIMLTLHGDRCLMGRGRHFAPGIFSALAGFIEPGETIENAVRRETLEEAGIRLGRVVYHASQPWPFPYSLMIGCYGEALNDDIVADMAELEACRWFTRAEVLQILAGNHPDNLSVPPTAAIAGVLIRHWARQGEEA